MKEADVLCIYGWSHALLQEMLPWLSSSANKRIVFVDENEALEAHVRALENPKVTAYVISTPLQIESIAARIGGLSVFLKLHIVDVRKSPYFPLFQERLLAHHELASLRLSDAADYGCTAMQNAFSNLANSYKSCMDLKGAFANVPAILVGAGPSLGKVNHLLATFKNKGIVFAGGNALKKIACPPHFGACIDKSTPVEHSFGDIPLSFQARMHPGNFQHFRGEALLAPDSHFSFLNFMSEKPLDGGWTVGNFMAALAVFWGCNPIVCVGMDFCYDSDKNAEEFALSQDRFGNSVWTQKDWLMARSWMEDLAKKHPHVSFYNASEGLAFWKPISLQDLDWKETNLQERIDTALQKLPRYAAVAKDPWKKALKAAQFCSEEGEIYSELLLPLWKVWSPIFEREVFGENMQVHQRIFFDNVIQEHLRVVQ